VAHVPPGLSCPNCGARAAAQAEACAHCGCRFVEAGRRPVRNVLRPAGAVAAVGAVTLVAWIALDAGDARPERSAPEARTGPEMLSPHPLSTRAVERRLEARFVSLRDDDSAAARCSPLSPRPAHAIRHCRIRYPSGAERMVVVLTNPQGRELLVEPR
jgi:hypothetical protein